MPALEVRRRGAAVETHELSPDEQVLVGQSSPADIIIDAPGVQPVHCRFTLKKNGCEVTAIVSEGVEFKGEKVRKAMLSPGDTVRMAGVEIRLVDGEAEEETEPPAEDRARSRSRRRGESRKEEKAEKAPALGNVFHTSPAARELGKFHVAAEADPLPEPKVVSISTELDAIEEQMKVERTEREQARVVVEKDEPFTQQLKEALARQRRPGEQEILRSPLVIGLTVGTLVLIVAAGAMYLILGRQARAAKFTAASDAYIAGQFPSAIEQFNLFLHDHPDDERAKEARLLLGKAKVDQLITGGSPDWTKGLAEIQEFIVQVRDDPEFQVDESELRAYVQAAALKVAEGAAKTAGQSGRRPLLAVSDEARKLVERYNPRDTLDKTVSQLDDLQKKAQSDVLRHETVEKSLQVIDKSLKDGKTLSALKEHKAIVLRYPDLEKSKPLRDRLNAALTREQEGSPRQADGPQAVREDRPAGGLPTLTLLRRTRERSDRVSAGETVAALVDDAFLGIDSVTGEPRFRRVTGAVSAFFPMAVSTSTPGWLAFDSRNGELLVVSRRDGALQWRLKLESVPVGPPLVADGQIYLALASGELTQIDLGTGNTQARVKFPQAIVGPPTPSFSGERLYVAGHEGVLYVLSRRPLACERAVHLGHGPGAIVAPMTHLRQYLLVPENHQVDQCRLRLFKMVPEDQPPREIDAETVTGQVRDACLVRGRDLFVPSVPERVTALTVSETDDDKALEIAATQQVPSGQPARMFLAAGPDGQLWMASTGLRRFQLSKDGLLPDGPIFAAGMVTQPLQAAGDSLFVARRLLYSRAVFVTDADRQRMIGEWQTTTGGEVIGCGVVTADKSIIAATSAGDLFRLTPDRLAAGGFEFQPLGGMNLGENPTDPLSAGPLADGSLAVWCGGSEPRLFQVGGETPFRTLKIAESLQAAPVPLSGGWLLPVAGKLKLSFRPPDQPAVQDWLAKIGKDDSPAWRGVLRLDDRQVLATAASGRVSRVQLTEGEQPHLSEVVHWDAGSPVDVPPVLTLAGVVVVDSQPQLTVLNPSSLEPREQQPLPAPVRRLSSTADRLFLEFKDKLACYSCQADQPLKLAFELPLSAPLAGPPVVQDETIILAMQTGRVVTLTPDGKESSALDVQQTLAFGPFASGDMVLVGGLDGSVMRVDERR